MRAAMRQAGVAVLFVLTACAPASAAEDLGDPVKLVRTLELLQDSIAAGTTPADARRELIEMVGTRLMAADPQVWTHPQNADAVLLYVLNGGNPSVMLRLAGTAGEDAERAKLIAAVGAYAVGSQADAMSLWREINLTSLPGGLVGPAALVKANLLMDSEPRKAMQFADIARLESPGSLVEEAALRRGIEIAAKLGDAERFAFYATDYTTRFPRSLYGAAFRTLLSESYLRLASRPGDDDALQLDAILAPLPLAGRIESYLEVARTAVVRADMTEAKAAAGTAVSLSAPDTIERRRAELYLAVALAFVGEPIASRAGIDALAKSDMPESDRELLDAVIAVVDQIQRWPDVASVKEPPSAEALDEAAGAGGPSISELTARAQASMESVGEVLEEADL
jgi:chemotaxis protein MotC